MSFIQKFLDYGGESECPRNYLLFASLAALAALVGRRVWINRGFLNYYPNLYVLNVGPPGNGKSFSRSMAKRLLEEIGGVNIGGDCLSPRKLGEDLAECRETFTWKGEERVHSPMLATPTELRNFLAQGKEQMTEMLLVLWDEEDYKYNTSHKGGFQIDKPALTVLTNATSDWITANLKDDVMSGGLCRRMISVFAEKRERAVPFPEITPAMKKLWDELVVYGKQVQGVIGCFEWSEDARMLFAEWYQQNKEFKGDSTLSGYYECKDALVLKLAMLIALAERLETRLTPGDITATLNYLSEMEKNLPRVFEGLGRNPLGAFAKQIVRKVMSSSNGGIPEATIRRMFFNQINVKEFDEVVLHLHQTGSLVRENRSNVFYLKKPEGARDDTGNVEAHH